MGRMPVRQLAAGANCRYGLFSHLWIDMMQRLGLDVTVIDCRWGDGADEAK